MKKFHLGLQVNRSSQQCQEIQIKLPTLPIYQLDMGQSSQTHQEDICSPRSAVLILQIYLKLEEQANSHIEHEWLPVNITKMIFKQGEYSAVDKKEIPQNRISTQSITPGLKILALKTSLLRDQWLIMALLIRGSWSRTTIHPLKTQGVLMQSIEILVSTGKRLTWNPQGELSLASHRANKSISQWNHYAQPQSVYRVCYLPKKKSKQKIWLRRLDQFLRISQKSWKIWHKAIRRCRTRSFRKKNLIDLLHLMKEMGSQW